MQENRNLLVAVLLSSIIIIGWGVFFPQNNKNARKKSTNAEKVVHIDENHAKQIAISLPQQQGEIVKISNGSVVMHINTLGLKIQNIGLEGNQSTSLINDDLIAQFGFVSNTHNMPNKETTWSVISKDKDSATFTTTKEGITFTQTLTLDSKSMLKINGTVQNKGKMPISFMIFSRINQSLAKIPPKNAISHEGPIAFVNAELQEKPYSKIAKSNVVLDSRDGKNSWAGFAEKYTLISFINKGEQKVTLSYKNNIAQGNNAFQVDSLSQTYALEPNAKFEYDSLLFVGTKHLKLLEQYAKDFDIPSFDKSIDFGFLYFITKPIFLLLSFIQSKVGNFAVSIIILTLLLKLMLLPLTMKSSISMAKLKNLQPEVKALQEQYKNNKGMLGQETIKLYRKKNVNPLAGCLPMLLQIPIFFALYKVLYVSIEMKNAHLFLWIKDLSSPDPTSLLNLYGLLDWNAPPFLGVLPILFGISMYLYQAVSPQPTDNNQAMMMKFLPVIMTVFMSGFAAGLLFYWIVSNIISALQQFILEKFVLVKHIEKR